MESIKDQIETINSIKTAGVQIRAKAQFIEENERSTTYFLNVEKRNYKMKHIKKLKFSGTESIDNPNKILEEEKQFYKTLYTRNKTLTSGKTFFNSKAIPKLTHYDKQMCEQPITIEECAKALLSLNNGKSPGSDGFPPDFYKMFWKNIKSLVFDSLLYGIENHELSIEQKRGVLKLILKKNKNPCYLKNWRPISLLNTDYKILAQIFSKRLQKVLPTIISEFQNGYIKDRYIGYNIRTIVDIINFSKAKERDCLIAFLDFEKAFDQLDWNFIDQTLTAFNFGPLFKSVVKTMYTNVSSCVTNNGYSSEFFQIERGIRQGCPLSALLFILAVEILSIKIRASPTIKGITINNYEIKLTQLADDTTLFLKNTQSLHNSFELINDFHKCSGLKLNYSKTEILPINATIDLGNAEVKIVEKSQSLGIVYFDNVETIISENYTAKYIELEKTLINWKKRKLTILGKNTVIKTLIVPKVNFIISNLTTPEWFVKEVQTLIQNFLWEDKPPKIKNKTITNTMEMGGIRFPNIELLVKAQKVSWIKRIILNKNAAWMQSLYTVLPDISIGHMLKCTIHPERLADYIPAFYRQILYAWFELAPHPKTAMDIRRQMVWYNKYITINKTPVFNKTLYEAGICCINDLLDQEGKILNYNNITVKYNIRIDPFYYMSLIDAIPNSWRQILKTCNFPLNIIHNDENPHLLINEQHKDITQVKSKEIYITYLKLNECKANCIEAWNKRLDIHLTTVDWRKIFILAKQTVCDSRILTMQYKILHRCYATNSIICKWDETKQEYCTICNQKANILHNFVTCSRIKEFWIQVTGMLRIYNIEAPNLLMAQDILFGKYIEAKYDMLNHLILYAKYYIHKQFIANKPVCVEHFFKYYYQIMVIEKQRYIEKDGLKLFQQRFGKSALVDKR